MARCRSTASPSRLTLLINSVSHSEEKVRRWVWDVQSSFTLPCTATSQRSSGTETVSRRLQDVDCCTNLHVLFLSISVVHVTEPSSIFSLDVLLSASKWYHMHWSGDRATLTLTHLNKEDEGLYTLRVTTKSGYETYSAYVFVRGGWTYTVLKS